MWILFDQLSNDDIHLLLLFDNVDNNTKVIDSETSSSVVTINNDYRTNSRAPTSYSKNNIPEPNPEDNNDNNLNGNYTNDHLLATYTKSAYIKSNTGAAVEILATPNKLQQLCAIKNTTNHKPVNKPSNLPLTGLNNLERLNNSRV